MWKEERKENKLLCCRVECLNHVRGGFNGTTNGDNVGAGIHENEVEDTACKPILVLFHLNDNINESIHFLHRVQKAYLASIFEY